MGKITNALKKATEERMSRLDKVAQIKERDKLIVQKIGESDIDPNVISYFDPKAVISEQYRILRTNLLSATKGKSSHALGITSSIHSEGKTVTSLNLAFSLAQAVSKPKVLLIDADLRRPSQSAYFGMSSQAGLVDLLNLKKDLEEILITDQYQNLHIIPAGFSGNDSTELISSQKFRLLMEHLKAEYDSGF